jgi:predicted nicotinamide N-methyase
MSMPPGATSVPPRTRQCHRKTCKDNGGGSSLRRGELLAALHDIGPLRVDRVDLPGNGGSLQITRPANFDLLLDAAVDDPEQNLPYWAEIWPSGIALAAAIAREPNALRQQRVLELGCGLGVTAIAALRASADLLVTDYSPQALALCALNTRDNAGLQPKTMRLNWRDPRPDLQSMVGGDGFPIVLAADVLYEERDVMPLLRLTERIVRPGGELWLAEPRRDAAGRFLETIDNRGWSRTQEQWSGPWPDDEDDRRGVKVNVHRLRRPPE